MRILKIISVLFILIIAVATNGQAQQSTASGDLSGNYPNPSAIGIQGKPISNTVPIVGQVLKWNGTAWEPATNLPGKPSVLFFNQQIAVPMLSANVATAQIPGLDNQSFTLTQSSRVVFHTTVVVRSESTNILTHGVAVSVSVEIRNQSGAVSARATSGSAISKGQTQTIVAEGIGILPAGTYSTKVTMNRQQGGTEIRVLDSSGGNANHHFQGGQIIIEIIPD